MRPASGISGKRGFRYSSSKPCSLLTSKFLSPNPISHSDSLHRCNSSTGSASDCCKIHDFNSLYRKKPLILQPNKGNFSRRFSPGCHFGLIPLLKKHFLFDSASGLSSISQSLLKGSFSRLSKCSISSISSADYWSSFNVQKPSHDGRRFSGRSFSVVSPSCSSNSMTALVCEVESGKSSKEAWNYGEKMTKKRGGDGVDSGPRRNWKIVEIIKNGGKDNDMETELSKVASGLPVAYINPVFSVLNSDRISGLRFFRWIQNDNLRLRLSAEVCSLVINNCGYLGDFASMESLLREFGTENICLGKNSFGFLPALNPDQDSLVKSVRKVIDLLNKVGGSCRNSGICSLAEMFCNLDMFEMAKFVTEITEKKDDSLRHILMRDRCKRGHCEEARGVMMKMAAPNVKSYNFLLGSLCKHNRTAEAYDIVEEMTNKRMSPDAITFEILINHSCSQGKLDLAKQFLDKMKAASVEPRHSTHVLVLKGFFRANQYEEAHQYAIDSCVKFGQSCAELYSLLADLHRDKGDVMAAQGLIAELMDKGLRPNFRVYRNVVKQLQKAGQQNLARDLIDRYSRFLLETCESLK